MATTSVTNTYDGLVAGTFPMVTERVTIASGADLSKGTILGVVTASGKYAAADTTASSAGNNVPVAVLLEDAAAGSADAVATVALTGEFNAAKLIAKRSGDAVSDFKTGLRSIGIFVKTVV